MGKYSTHTQRDLPKKSREPHEIWRGFGCLIMILIPIISIAAGSETISWLKDSDMNFIPRQMMGMPRLPDFMYKSSGLLTIFLPITKVENFYAIATASILYMVTLSGIISVVYAAVYSMVAPSRYGPTDAPPPKIRITKKSR
jgi:hypothetical protein